MYQQRDLIQDNIGLLTQGRALIAGLDDSSFTEPPDGVLKAGIGSHLRHCLDFYDSLLCGLRSGLINYDARARDLACELQRALMEKRISQTIASLARIPVEDLSSPVRVILEGGRMPTPSQSSLARELQFLLSHTVHHFALVAVILRLQGREVPDHFGVAPSSLAHWKERARGAA